MYIDLNRAERKNIRLLDPTGALYELDGKLYRVINNEYADEFRQLLSSGLIDELTAQNLFPKTTISENRIEGYDLVIEHEKLPVVTYPYEWTFDMFKSAALSILKINIIAEKYGYRTIDAHSYNFVFRYAQPVFVDLGSIRPIKKGFTSWIPIDKFIRHYYYPTTKSAGISLRSWRQSIYISSAQQLRLSP